MTQMERYIKLLGHIEVIDPYGHFGIFNQEAILAIKAGREALMDKLNCEPPNVPLTIEQLVKTMNDEKPVHVRQIDDGFTMLAIIDVIHENGKSELVAIWGADPSSWYKEGDYNKTWVAYSEPIV